MRKPTKDDLEKAIQRRDLTFPKVFMSYLLLLHSPHLSQNSVVLHSLALCSSSLSKCLTLCKPSSISSSPLLSNRLQGFGFVGLVEHFNLSVCLFHAAWVKAVLIVNDVRVRGVLGQVESDTRYVGKICIKLYRWLPCFAFQFESLLFEPPSPKISWGHVRRRMPSNRVSWFAKLCWKVLQAINIINVAGCFRSEEGHVNRRFSDSHEISSGLHFFGSLEPLIGLWIFAQLDHRHDGMTWKLFMFVMGAN